MANIQWDRRTFLRTSLFGVSAVALGSACGAEAKNLAFRRDTIAYGPAPMQTGELKVAVLPGPRPTAVMIHGGYWRLGFERSEMADLAQDLARQGYAVWNIDYRRVGEAGGGWPGTFTDVALAIDKLAELAPTHNLDLSRVVTIGHSAGGQLALWAATRAKNLPYQPGGAPKVNPKAVVSLSGVLDMAGSAHASNSAGEIDLRDAVVDVIGGTPERQPARYALTSPMALLPLGVPQILLHGSKDEVVPVEQSRAYVTAAAKAGDPTRLIELPNVDHFDVVISSRLWWDEVVAWLRTNVGDPLA